LVKEKFYFPISEDYTNIIGITGSKGCLVFPIAVNGISNFHVTAFIKTNIAGDCAYDIHLTENKINRHIPLFSGTISKDSLDNFGTKCKQFAIDILPILNKHTTNIEESRKHELYCIDCTLTKTKLPNELSQTRLFWEKLNSTTDLELISQYNLCKDEKHSFFYDTKSKMVICRYTNGVCLGFRDILEFMEEMGALISERFSPEIEKLEIIRDNIFQKIQNEVINYS